MTERPGDGLRRTLWLVLVPVFCLITLPFLLLEVGPAYEARFGGTDGVFTARSEVCGDGGCAWRGDFRSDDGRVERTGVRLIGGGPDAVGDEVGAVDTGSEDAVYPAGGGSNWLVITGLLLVVLAALSWWVRAVRRERQARRTDSSASP